MAQLRTQEETPNVSAGHTLRASFVPHAALTPWKPQLKDDEKQHDAREEHELGESHSSGFKS